MSLLAAWLKRGRSKEKALPITPGLRRDEPPGGLRMGSGNLAPLANRTIYPSWLPASPRERMELVKMRRRRHVVIAWMLGLIPGVGMIVLFAPDESVFVPCTLVWIALGLWFAERVGAMRCPRCGYDFCGKHELASWYVLFNSRCENRGLTLENKGE